MPGLRREEVAQVAGVSVDYYARLEQGRLENVSFAVLDAVATALQLSADERTHLHNLACPPLTTDHPDTDPPTLRPALQALLDAMEHIPAYIVGHHTNIPGWNRAAELLFGIDFASLPVRQRNWTHLVFLDPHVRALTVDARPALTRQLASDLRLRIGHRPGDTALNQFINEMRSASTEFEDLWTSHDVTDVAFGTYHLRHPALGSIALDYEFLPLMADPGVRALVTYTATPDSPRSPGASHTPHSGQVARNTIERTVAATESNQSDGQPVRSCPSVIGRTRCGDRRTPEGFGTPG